VSTARRRWLYAQIFCPLSLDRLLVDCVGSAMSALERDGWITSWFFIRYAEEGSHLRLRVRGHGRPDRVIAERLEAGLVAYFADRGIERGDAETPDPNRWRVRYRTYEPEIDRYGGPEAMVAAETHFCASSAIVLQRLPACIPNPSARLATAIELFLVQLQASELTDEQSDAFCERFIVGQFAYQVPAERVAQALESCEAKFVKTSARLVPYLARALEEAPAGAWFQHCHAYHRTLAELERRGKLQDEVGVLFSQIHMTNNRLGIPNIEEPYVAYLARRALQVIGESHSTRTDRSAAHGTPSQRPDARA
jgi:thiopeptide-type bacteriocin biosynthesis protein